VARCLWKSAKDLLILHPMEVLPIIRFRLLDLHFRRLLVLSILFNVVRLDFPIPRLSNETGPSVLFPCTTALEGALGFFAQSRSTFGSSPFFSLACT